MPPGRWFPWACAPYPIGIHLHGVSIDVSQENVRITPRFASQRPYALSAIEWRLQATKREIGLTAGAGATGAAFRVARPRANVRRLPDCRSPPSNYRRASWLSAMPAGMRKGKLSVRREYLPDRLHVL